MKKKLVRTTTIPSSMRGLLTGQLKYMSDYYDVIAITSDGDVYDKMLEEQHVRGYKVPFTRDTFSIGKDIKSFFMLIKIFRKERPFIVHSHMSKDGLLCMVAAWLCKVPNRFYTIAGLADIPGIRGFLLNIAEWVTFRCATKLYPISQNMLDIYVNRGMFKREKAKVIFNGSSNGFDADFFSRGQVHMDDVDKLRKELSIMNNSFVFCSIGRIVKDKGINELIKAFLLLQKDGLNVELLMLGNFENQYNPIDENTKYEIGHNSHIHYVGYQSDIRPYLMLSNTLVHASYREGFGNVIAQAGLMDLPSIVTNICGPNEIIKDGINGNIIPRKNVKALYDMMKYYYNNIPEVDRMGSNARKLIVDRYKRSDLWKAILQEYKSYE